MNDPHGSGVQPQGEEAFPTIPGWTLERVLGSGGQAVAFLSHRNSSPPAMGVIKVLREWAPGGKQSSATAQRARFDLEIATMRKLVAAGCPGIVSLVDACEDALTCPVPWYAMPFFQAGAMCRRDERGSVIDWAENFRGNVQRVLEVAEALAETLTCMHEMQVVHRDVHTSNVFFETLGGTPILGDFGLVHDREVSPPDLTGGREDLGPWRWRPPELQAGSRDVRDPASDVYLLGGLIYEALSGGEHIGLTQHDDGTFTHELPDFSLARWSDDARTPLISKLLRGMLAWNPRARLSISRVRESLRQVKNWTPGRPPPVVLPAHAQLALVAERARQLSPSYHADRIPPLLLKVVEPAVARLVALNPHVIVVKGSGSDLLTRKRLPSEIRKHHFTTLLTAGKVDRSDPLHALQDAYAGYHWVRVWVKVFFGPEPEVECGSRIFFGRSVDRRQAIVAIDDNITPHELWTSFADDPMEEDALLGALEGELERVSQAAADVVNARVLAAVKKEQL